MLQENVPLKSYSSYKIGGPASFFLDFETKEELLDGFKKWQETDGRKDRIFILGRGTNVLIDDKGFDGLLIHNIINGIKQEGDNIVVGAGVLIKDVLDFCIKNSLSGLEWAGGLPGTIGGAVRGNAGAFGGEIKDSVYKVKSVSLLIFDEFERLNGECDFGYRRSIFKDKKTDEVILYVSLKLKKGDKNSIEKGIEDKILYRKERHPLEYPNVGSVFKNIPLSKVPKKYEKEFEAFIKNDPFPIIPTAKVLALANLKGKRIGDAQVSTKHPNFIVNLENATSKDVKALIALVKKTIKEKFEIELEEELTYLN
jgi:UDP-N-acetylmuramate dehydrogenase